MSAITVKLSDGCSPSLECLVMFHIFNAVGGTVISLGLASFKIVIPYL